MCGIAGFQLSTRERVTPSAWEVSAHLLGEIEHRGKDATGAAWRDPATGEVWIQKDRRKASRFIRDMEVQTDSRTVILHTRYATLGDPAHAVNNHPIDVGGLIGVHNGMVRNHRDIFAILKGKVDVTRFGAVDSEAIFALLYHGRDVFGGADWPELLSLVDASMATAWMTNDPTDQNLHLARGAGSPLHVAQTRGGSFYFASTQLALRKMAMACGVRFSWESPIPEGTYLRVRDGRLVETREFDPGATFTPRRPDYSRPSRYAKAAR